MSQVFLLKQQQKRLKPLHQFNMPEMIYKKDFSRIEMIQTYCQFKVLMMMQTFKKDLDTVINTRGVSFETFLNSIFHIYLLGEEKARILFNQLDVNNRGYLTEKEFLSAMKNLMIQTKKNKLELFMKVADSDGNGMLSFDEVFHLSFLSTQNNFKFANRSVSEEFIKDLALQLTKFIFKTFEMESSQDISLQRIMEYLTQENKNQENMLLFFCGADYS